MSARKAGVVGGVVLGVFGLVFPVAIYVVGPVLGVGILMSVAATTRRSG